MEEVKALYFTKGPEVYKAVVAKGGPRAGCVMVLAGKVVQAGVSRIRVNSDDLCIYSGTCNEDQPQGLPKDAGLAVWQPTPEDAVAHLLASAVRRVKSAQEEMRQAQAELLAVEQYTGVSVKV